MLILFTFTDAFTQSLLTISEAKSLLAKSQRSIESVLTAKGIKPSEGTESIAQEFAENLSQLTSKKLLGKGYMHPSNYAIMDVFSKSGACVVFQFGTKRPKDGEVKALATALLNAGYKKWEDRESENGSSNIRSYTKGDVMFTLSAYYNGGYTLTAYQQSAFE
ncbi:hypothetical protein [Hymenobacter sp. DG25B]|uniref:hypothetical protein n=1 Tax=Hymenobacter sp. DG25B TaxID=1385664 RepID=UPI0012E087BF|nr:hypothetical protein [Hymenobacter sp. DG25B]